MSPRFVRRRTVLWVRRSGLRGTGVIALVVLSLVAVVLAPANADTRDKKKAVDAKVSAAQSELAESSKAVAKAAAALKRARTELPAAQRALRDARTERTAAREVEQAVLEELRRAQERVAAEQLQVDAVLASMDTTRRTIGTIARTVYTQGPYAEIELVLESQDPGDFAERIQSVRTVVKDQDRTLAGLAEQRALLQQRTDDLRVAQEVVNARRIEAQQQREAAERAADSASAAKAKVDALVAARKDALKVAAREKAKTARQLRFLKREQGRLATLLAGPGKAGSFPSGSLQWPVAAPLSGSAGPRIHPIYGYPSCHEGVDISAPTGTVIVAAAAGTVLSASLSPSYGLFTVIDHGDGLATAYAHQSRVEAVTGDRVKRGQVIGYVGSTGNSTGPHLHFEVRVGGAPYDPMGWFGAPRKPVAC